VNSRLLYAVARPSVVSL